MSLTSIVSFQDGRTDSYFSDKSTISLHNTTVTYYTPSGLKTQLQLSSLQPNSQLHLKLKQFSNTFNLYSDIPFPLYSDCPDDYCTKPKKITEYLWPDTVTETQNGWRLVSLDGDASVELQRDLVILKVEYLQYVDKVVATQDRFMYTTENLLRKYRRNYCDLNMEDRKEVVTHRHVRIRKLFSIAHVPDRWRYPSSLIWQEVARKKGFKETPAFPAEYSEYAATPVPQPILPSQNQLSPPCLPIFLHPNHTSPCRFISMLVPKPKSTNSKPSRAIIWFRQGCTLAYDGQMFWLQIGDTFHLKLFNTVQTEKIYHICAVPEVVRFDNYVVNAKQMLKVMWQYDKHAKGKLQTIVQQPAKQSNGNTLIAQLQNQVGTFKAYANKIIQAKFRDKTYVTLTSGKFRIVTKDGQTINVASTDLQFKKYIEQVLAFQEEVFYEKEKMWRDMAKESLIDGLRRNDIAMSILEGRPIESRIVETTQISVEQMLQRNRQMLEKLRRD